MWGIVSVTRIAADSFPLKQEYRTNPDNGDELLSTKEQDITDAQFYQVGNNVPQSGGGVEIGYDISSTDRTYNS